MKIAFIYLAAGNSRRFGSNKLLFEFNGKQLYLHLLERLERICRQEEAWESEIIVVTQYKEIYDEALRRGLHSVLSPDSKKGASYSIRAGLTAAENAEYGVFFAADQPFLTEETVKKFLASMVERKAQLGCVSCSGHNGNPVWFSRKYFPELCLLQNDEGGRKILKRYEKDVCRFEVNDEKELEDIDVNTGGEESAECWNIIGR